MKITFFFFNPSQSLDMFLACSYFFATEALCSYILCSYKNKRVVAMKQFDDQCPRRSKTILIIKKREPLVSSQSCLRHRFLTNFNEFNRNQLVKKSRSFPASNFYGLCSPLIAFNLIRWFLSIYLYDFRNRVIIKDNISCARARH